MYNNCECVAGIRGHGFMKVGQPVHTALQAGQQQPQQDVKKDYYNPIGCAYNGVDGCWSFCDTGHHVVRSNSSYFIREIPK